MLRASAVLQTDLDYPVPPETHASHAGADPGYPLDVKELVGGPGAEPDFAAVVEGAIDST